MDDQALWGLIRAAQAGLGETIDRAIEPIVADSGLNARGWGLLLAVLTFEPENTTPSHLTVRGPYTAAEEYLLRMSLAAGLGFLEEVAQGEYRLTPAGRTAVQHFIHTARSAMVEADPMPFPDSTRLAVLLGNLVQCCLNAPEPPKTWSIRLSYKLMPELEPPLPYIEQAFSCLVAYRDDAHLAAWRNSDLAATALEALTLLWRKEAGSYADINAKLVHRGHPSQVYEDAVDELRSRGFVAGQEDSLHLTYAGVHFREQIEEETNRYFFAPWSCMDWREKEEMEKLLVRLRDRLHNEQ